MPRISEPDWKNLTAWTGTPPPPAAVWQLTEEIGADVPLARRAEGLLTKGIEPLKASLAQYLLAAGLDLDEARDEFHRRTGYRPTAATITNLATLGLKTKSDQRRVRFTNLVSGRFTELVFLETYQRLLENVGLIVSEELSDRTFIDFRTFPKDPGEEFSLGVNTKNAGVQMVKAEDMVGLAPEDTLPMATYKAFGAYDKALRGEIPHVVYVYLADWDLLEQLRGAYWELLGKGERTLFKALANFSVSMDLEDEFIDRSVRDRITELAEAVGYISEGLAPPFRTVSAARCCQIFFERRERSPYVFQRRMNTDPNVHISVANETVAFDDFLAEYLSSPDRRADLLSDLTRTTSIEIPNPSV